ncbi:MAG: glycoside hydrolase family 3 protein, partial [Acidobacteria bacterium]
SQLVELILGVREVCPEPPALAVDLEGGPVNRLAHLDPALARLPAARIQAAWPTERLERVWRGVGDVLAALGFDIDFAPVVDLDEGDGSNGIGPRAFGAEPGRVAAAAGAVLAGLAAAGVAGCLKHFPGLGETETDTHESLAVCEAAADRLWDRHARPFRELAARSPLVMIAHAWYPAVDPGDPLPATFSERLVTGWLRERCRYEGLVITDDLTMGALRAWPSPGERALRALRAGADLVLFCRDLDAPRRARDALARALERGDLPEDQPERALSRLAGLLERSRPAGASTREIVSRAAEAARRLGEFLA